MTNLELLEQEFSDVKNEGILKYLIPVLEDFEERIKKLERAQSCVKPDDNKYVVEQYTDYCIGGADDIIIGLDDINQEKNMNK